MWLIKMWSTLDICSQGRLRGCSFVPPWTLQWRQWHFVSLDFLSVVSLGAAVIFGNKLFLIGTCPYWARHSHKGKWSLCGPPRGGCTQPCSPISSKLSEDLRGDPSPEPDPLWQEGEALCRCRTNPGSRCFWIDYTSLILRNFLIKQVANYKARENNIINIFILMKSILFRYNRKQPAAIFVRGCWWLCQSIS